MIGGDNTAYLILCNSGKDNNLECTVYSVLEGHSSIAIFCIILCTNDKISADKARCSVSVQQHLLMFTGCAFLCAAAVY